MPVQEHNAVLGQSHISGNSQADAGIAERAPSTGSTPNQADKSKCDCVKEREKAKAKRAEEAKENRDENVKATREGWKKCADGLRAHDENLAKMWKEEIDALLVFAGLFSAVLTTFNAQVYTSLKPDPGVDLSNQLLFQISTQLSAFFNDSSTDAQRAAFSIPISTTSPASPTSIWINTLWFMSLVLSLASASIGIVVRQWLNHFISPTSTDPEQSALIHCLRYDAGLRRWHVPEILSLLPVLLLASLVLFLLGLLILLGSLNSVVTGIVIILIVLLLAFFAFTTVAPSVRPDCPYKSPQSFLSYWRQFEVFHGGEFGTRQEIRAANQIYMRFSTETPHRVLFIINQHELPILVHGSGAGGSR
ncbi:hypothetical protein OBBRIDRAFT_838279 [Obba rivulosa]|uniref:DUF6535 domain-containing protein n=1 Tax=Obba rivulosa TaxID=1052685 RepID=A0A8E2AVS3_9APHY|nr:hypothetical protein OBBRIDRAFT_838279 [Obba rivulosa]